MRAGSEWLKFERYIRRLESFRDALVRVATAASEMIYQPLESLPWMDEAVARNAAEIVDLLSRAREVGHE